MNQCQNQNSLLNPAVGYSMASTGQCHPWEISTALLWEKNALKYPKLDRLKKEFLKEKKKRFLKGNSIIPLG